MVPMSDSAVLKQNNLRKLRLEMLKVKLHFHLQSKLEKKSI